MEKLARPEWNGANLKALRELRGLSADQLGAAVGSNRSQISKWERGENTPGGDYVIAFALFFNVSAGYFFRGTEAYEEEAVKRMTEMHVAAAPPVRYTRQELDEMARSPLPGRRARARLSVDRLEKRGATREADESAQEEQPPPTRPVRGPGPGR
jgi:transcriptional regulator with XRE-family HTH domain